MTMAILAIIFSIFLPYSIIKHLKLYRKVTKAQNLLFQEKNLQRN